MMYISQSYYNTELYHHGVLGQKWGVRRYQPYGQGYTPVKKNRYTSKDIKEARKNLDSLKRKMDDANEDFGRKTDALAKEYEKEEQNHLEQHPEDEKLETWELDEKMHYLIRNKPNIIKAVEDTTKARDLFEKHRDDYVLAFNISNKKTGAEHAKRFLGAVGGITASVLASYAVSGLANWASNKK